MMSPLNNRHSNHPNRRRLLRWLAAMLGLPLNHAAPAAPRPMTDIPLEEDPFLWLEEVQGERALAWVREHNAITRRLLEAEPGFLDTRSALRAILDSRAQIPQVVRRGDWLYNLWRDDRNPRGLWRRATLAEYRQAEPTWQVLLDLDTLARGEGENWVWAGASAFGPAYRRAMVSLSRGGADAAVVREFDLDALRFVPATEGGFTLPEAKTSVDWVDADTLLVATDFGPGTLTDSGYARTIRRWARGTLLADAPLVFEGESGDVSVWAHVDRTPGFERHSFGRSIDFYTDQVFLQQGATLRLLDKPADAQLSFWRSHVLLSLRSDWTVAGKTYTRGSLLAADADAWLAGGRDFRALFTPSATRSLAAYTATRSTIVLDLMDNVASRLEEWRPGPDGWTRRAVSAPFPGNLGVAPLHDTLMADDPLAEDLLLSYADFLTPDSLLLGHSGSDERQTLKSRPSFFDSSGMRVEQRFASSKDGTRVPYFIVWPRGARDDGDNPALLYGYGGFEVSLQPMYSGTLGQAWLSRGGVYAMANIRGGGEFGPGWHQAALTTRRQNSFDDFIAVAEDLQARGVTRPARLGLQGGSNGGLLVGAVLVQRPELFGAVVCQVPLLDMKRYHRLLAGASWMAEYGDPDDPVAWASMARWSPYQNVPAAPPACKTLPPVLFTGSTRDDRVHPGHARKMAARLLERGHRALLWENIEGGHGGAADNAQRADNMALEFAFLWRQLRRAAL